MAEPTTAASAMRATAAACSGVRMPNPTAQGRRDFRRMRATADATSSVETALGSRNPGHRYVIEKPAGTGEHGFQPPVTGRWSRQPHDVDPVCGCMGAQGAVFLRRKVHNDQPIDSGMRRVAQEMLAP